MHFLCHIKRLRVCIRGSRTGATCNGTLARLRFARALRRRRQRALAATLAGELSSEMGRVIDTVDQGLSGTPAQRSWAKQRRKDVKQLLAKVGMQHVAMHHACNGRASPLPTDCMQAGRHVLCGCDAYAMHFHPAAHLPTPRLRLPTRRCRSRTACASCSGRWRQRWRLTW